MDNLFRLLLRLVLVPVGFLAALITGMLVILFGQWRVGSLLTFLPDDPDAMLMVLNALISATFLILWLVSTMWIVGAIGVLFAEVFAVRSWLFHTINGAVSAFAGEALFPYFSGESAPLADPFYILAAGLGGGLAYWLTAGWSAGFWKPLLTAPARPPVPPPGAG